MIRLPVAFAGPRPCARRPRRGHRARGERAGAGVSSSPGSPASRAVAGEALAYAQAAHVAFRLRADAGGHARRRRRAASRRDRGSAAAPGPQGRRTDASTWSARTRRTSGTPARACSRPRRRRRPVPGGGPVQRRRPGGSSSGGGCRTRRRRSSASRRSSPSRSSARTRSARPPTRPRRSCGSSSLAGAGRPHALDRGRDRDHDPPRGRLDLVPPGLPGLPVRRRRLRRRAGEPRPALRADRRRRRS